MVDFLGVDIPLDFTPDAGQSVASSLFGDVVLWLTVIVTIAVGAAIWYGWWFFKVYKFKIEVYENIAGTGYRKNFFDRARLVKLGNGGEEILYLKKKKMYRTAYGRKIAKDTYMFVVGQDGYWYNCVHGDLDARMGMLDIEPIDRDMRYMHVAIGRNIQDRYRKKSTEKIVGIAVGGLVLMSLILMIGGWYMFDKMAENQAVNIQASVETVKVIEAAERVVASLDNVINQGGLRPVG